MKIQDLVITLGLLVAAGTASALPDTSKLLPWPGEDGKWLQLLQDDDKQWFMAMAVVKSGKTTTTIAKVDKPSRPDLVAAQSLLPTTIHTIGTDCHSVMFAYIPQRDGKSYWLGNPRNGAIKMPSCPITSLDGKWQFVTE